MRPLLPNILRAWVYASAALFLLAVPVAVFVPFPLLRDGQTALTIAFALVVIWRMRSGERLESVTLGQRDLRILFACALVYCVGAELLLYTAYQRGAVDFSIFDWALTNTLRGRFMYSPIYDVNHFGVHPSYVLLALLPIHAVFGKWALLLASPIAVWAAMPLVFKLAKKLGAPDAIAVLATVAYLSCPLTGGLIRDGFRPESFYPLATALFALGWVSRSRRVWIAGLILLLSIKEDAALICGAFAMGTLLFDRSRWREAVAILAASVAVLVVNVAVVQPRTLGDHASASAYGRFWSEYGSSFGGIVIGMLKQPVHVLAQVVTSGAGRLVLASLFLPLLAPRVSFALLPSFVLFGTSAYPYMREIRGYYGSAVVLLLVWAMVEAWRALSKLRWRTEWAAAALLVFPLWGGGYLRLSPPKWDALHAQDDAIAALKGFERRCVQQNVLPHVPLSLSPEALLDRSCLDDPRAGTLVHPGIDPDPFKEDELSAMVTEAGDRASRLPGGFVLIQGGRAR